MKGKELTNDNYLAMRNMLGALAERMIYRHNTLCNDEDDVTITAIANMFVQENGDKMLLDIIKKVQEIYSRHPQRYRLIVELNGDQFQTQMFSYLNIEECLDVVQNDINMYGGVHNFIIIDTDPRSRKVYGNEEVMGMLYQRK